MQLLTPPHIRAWQTSDCGVPYVHELSSGEPGADVLVTALVHGNEFSGAIALDELLRLAPVPRTGRITVAFCNVAAFERFDANMPHASRYVEQDFNRVWSAELLHGTQQSVELQRARELLPFVARATHLLDLHSMHEPCTPLVVTGMLARNRLFARDLGAGVRSVVDAGHADGVRMRDYGDFGREGRPALALLLEAGQHWQPQSLHVVRDVLARFLCATQTLAREQLPSAWFAADADAQDAIHVTHRVVAKSRRVQFAAPYQGLEVIPKAGTVIAHDNGEPVTTPYDNCVLVMPSLAQLRPGVTVMRLGHTDP
jgi:predicted deacylase